MEENRLNININDLENNLKDLKNKIDGIPCPFVFNIDEVGVQEYADNEEKKLSFRPVIHSKLLHME